MSYLRMFSEIKCYDTEQEWAVRLRDKAKSALQKCSLFRTKRKKQDRFQQDGLKPAH